MYFDEIIEDSVRFTNLEGRRVTVMYNRTKARKKMFRPVTKDEMCAFFGLHILGGLFKARHRTLDSIWSERDGIPAFRATMSCQRFKQIKRFFRVDDRQRRDLNDPLSPVRDVWNLLDGKLRAFYSPDSNLTIDEQLVEFHGRIMFRVYIPSKPGCYGIKSSGLTRPGPGMLLLAYHILVIEHSQQKKKLDFLFRKQLH